MRKFILAGLLVAVAIVLGTSNAGTADVGPSQVYSEGGAVKPGAETDISMENEKVVLTYSRPEKSNDDNYGGIMKAHVVATFKMKAAKEQTMKVYFPSDDGAYVGGMGGADITGFKVNGTQLPNTLVNVSAGGTVYSNDAPAGMIRAYQWDQKFPAGETTLTIEYDTKSGKSYGLYNLTYVLGTGRGWKGPIKSGEVDFVFQDAVPSWAVTGDAPMIRQNKLSYSVSDKTIKVAFSNYEPAYDDVIALGLADPEVVSQIEKSNQTKPATFDSALKSAGLMRKLSLGAHCYFCVSPQAEEAVVYYKQAMNLANSKAQLEQLLMSAAYGDNNAKDNTLGKLYGWFTYFTDKRTCTDKDSDCNEQFYYFVGSTPFGPTANSSEPPKQADFLARYACRLRPYDFDTATLIENYAIRRYESCPTTTETKTTQDSLNVTAKPAATAAKPTIDWQLAAIVAAISEAVLIVGMTIGILVARHRRNKRPAAKGDNTPHTQS